jgi:hypothetical protein
LNKTKIAINGFIAILAFYTVISSINIPNMLVLGEWVEGLVGSLVGRPKMEGWMEKTN